MQNYQMNQINDFIDNFLKIKDQEDSYDDMFSQRRIIFYENHQETHHEFYQTKETEEFKEACNLIEFFTTSDGEEDEEPSEQDAEFIIKEETEKASEQSIEPRQVNKIQVDNKIVILRNHTKKGTRFETHNLGYYFYRLTLQQLKTKDLLGHFQDRQIEKIKQFEISKGKFNSFYDLFENEIIKKRCEEFYSSQRIIKNILKSQKLQIDKKLTMIKYVQKMRLQVETRNKSWKK